MMSPATIAFGIIVLNGEPFLRYNLRALYPFARQIIVVEGASRHASHAATPDGHSIDGTLAILRSFKEEEDPDDKLTIVTAEDCGYANGFWPGEKDEQSRAYAERCTSDYLWQIDVDEFYREDRMHWVCQMLQQQPDITAVTFPELSFWGSFDYYCDGPYIRAQYSKVHRLFRWGRGSRYVTHRPPTVVDERGRDLRSLRWVRAEQMAQAETYIYHYCQVFPAQVTRKMGYYEKRQAGRAYRPMIQDVQEWSQHVFENLRDPFHVHTVNSQISWLEPFRGEHPRQIRLLKADVESGQILVNVRSMADVGHVLQSRRFRLRRWLYEIWADWIWTPRRIVADVVRGRNSPWVGFRRLCGVLSGSERLFSRPRIP